jgi:adenine-specific DNA-methyltransferase
MIGELIQSSAHYIIWYSKSKEKIKYRKSYSAQIAGIGSGDHYTSVEEVATGYSRPTTQDEKRNSELIKDGWKPFQLVSLSTGGFRPNTTINYQFHGENYHPGMNKCWRTTKEGLDRLKHQNRIVKAGKTLRYKQFLDDFPLTEITTIWNDTGRDVDKWYVVQTPSNIVKRCILTTTDPGDLVLDPTCGSATTAYVAEQWGRRWITIDTSRVALALARARIMGARYPYYLLADSPEGQKKEAQINRAMPSETPTHNNIRLGFVYDRVPHITLKSIANNTEIDTIWESYQTKLEPLREALNTELSKSWEEWEIPREVEAKWSDNAKQLHGDWWKQRIARQKEIDASIAAKADREFLYDKPYEDKSTVRVAGPFTVESLSPHRVLAVDENDDLIDPDAKPKRDTDEIDFVNIILENLKTSGVQQAHKEDKINFTSLVAFPGQYICAEGRYVEGESNTERRAGIFIGSEYGTVSRPDLVSATREAGDLGFDVLIACAFNYDAHSAEFNKLGRIPILKARMNADLHMANDLKNTGAGGASQFGLKHKYLDMENC